MGTTTYSLFFCRALQIVGPFVIMIYRMIAKDLLRFFVIYLIFIMGYSQAYYIIFQTYNDNKCKRLSSGSGNCLQFMPHNAPFESFFRMFDMSLGHFTKLYRLLPYCKLPLHIIGKMHFLTFIMIVTILLINLLIAMMGNTYGEIAAIKNEWMRQWAQTVLLVERGISPSARLRSQDGYCEYMADGTKALLLKKIFSEAEKAEMISLIGLKKRNIINAERRRKAFGKETN